MTQAVDHCFRLAHPRSVDDGSKDETVKVIVLGAGVVGVTAAWYLAKEGHEVTVVDRQPAAALETSFANAGQISPGFSAPWAEPACRSRCCGG